ncbi:hypothetical protein APTSU1_001437800 [Apodemus speciosus]|uniref:Uncharacterized protein n=1 Tax=Apodemus speciosus TaxID=105296 RepID=A0ABQ0FIR0_APOSI
MVSPGEEMALEGSNIHTYTPKASTVQTSARGLRSFSVCEGVKFGLTCGSTRAIRIF